MAVRSLKSRYLRNMVLEAEFACLARGIHVIAQAGQDAYPYYVAAQLSTFADRYRC